MHVRRLKQVVVDLVEILNLAYEVGAYVFLAAESLKTAPHAHKGVGRDRAGTAATVLAALRFRIDPLLDVDDSCAVINPVCDVSRLRLDRAHLAHNGHLGYWVAVDGKLGAGEGLFPIEKLFYGYGAEGLVGVLLLDERQAVST